MQPITKQLIVAAFILALVTVASLGIRQVRFSVNRTKTVESSVATEAEPDPLPTESDTVDLEPEPQYTEVPEPEEEAPMDDYPEPEPSKGDYAKAMGKGSEGIETISLGENENLYLTGVTIACICGQ